MTVNAKFLGQGWAFPPLPSPGFPWVSGEDAVAQALRSLLLTEPGERLGRPTYGSGLRRFLFMPNTLTLRTRMQKTVEEAIERDEPRVKLEEVTVESDHTESTLVLIRIRYKIPGNLGSRNMVFPYYLDKEP
jgi:phage baseplate assembly protein W